MPAFAGKRQGKRRTSAVRKRRDAAVLLENGLSSQTLNTSDIERCPFRRAITTCHGCTSGFGDAAAMFALAVPALSAAEDEQKNQARTLPISRSAWQGIVNEAVVLIPCDTVGIDRSANGSRRR
jgi:hypothetical protein